jgi:hypothetical protein
MVNELHQIKRDGEDKNRKTTYHKEPTHILVLVMEECCSNVD